MSRSPRRRTGNTDQPQEIKKKGRSGGDQDSGKQYGWLAWHYLKLGVGFALVAGIIVVLAIYLLTRSTPKTPWTVVSSDTGDTREGEFWLLTRVRPVPDIHEDFYEPDQVTWRDFQEQEIKFAGPDKNMAIVSIHATGAAVQDAQDNRDRAWLCLKKGNYRAAEFRRNSASGNNSGNGQDRDWSYWVSLEDLLNDLQQKAAQTGGKNSHVLLLLDVLPYQSIGDASFDSGAFAKAATDLWNSKKDTWQNLVVVLSHGPNQRNWWLAGINKTLFQFEVERALSHGEAESDDDDNRIDWQEFKAFLGENLAQDSATLSGTHNSTDPVFLMHSPENNFAICKFEGKPDEFKPDLSRVSGLLNEAGSLNRLWDLFGTKLEMGLAEDPVKLLAATSMLIRMEQLWLLGQHQEQEFTRLVRLTEETLGGIRKRRPTEFISLTEKLFSEQKQDEIGSVEAKWTTFLQKSKELAVAKQELEALRDPDSPAPTTDQETPPGGKAGDEVPSLKVQKDNKLKEVNAITKEVGTLEGDLLVNDWTPLAIWNLAAQQEPLSLKEFLDVSLKWLNPDDQASTKWKVSLGNGGRRIDFVEIHFLRLLQALVAWNDSAELASWAIKCRNKSEQICAGMDWIWYLRDVTSPEDESLLNRFKQLEDLRRRYEDRVISPWHDGLANDFNALLQSLTKLQSDLETRKSLIRQQVRNQFALPFIVQFYQINSRTIARESFAKFFDPGEINAAPYDDFSGQVARFIAEKQPHLRRDRQNRVLCQMLLQSPFMTSEERKLIRKGYIDTCAGAMDLFGGPTPETAPDGLPSAELAGFENATFQDYARVVAAADMAWLDLTNIVFDPEEFLQDNDGGQRDGTQWYGHWFKYQSALNRYRVERALDDFWGVPWATPPAERNYFADAARVLAARVIDPDSTHPSGRIGIDWDNSQVTGVDLEREKQLVELCKEQKRLIAARRQQAEDYYARIAALERPEELTEGDEFKFTQPGLSGLSGLLTHLFKNDQSDSSGLDLLPDALRTTFNLDENGFREIDARTQVKESRLAEAYVYRGHLALTDDIRVNPAIPPERTIETEIRTSFTPDFHPPEITTYRHNPKPQDVVIVVDASNSMKDHVGLSGLPVAKMAITKDALRSLLDMLKHENAYNIDLIAFGATSRYTKDNRGFIAREIENKNVDGWQDLPGSSQPYNNVTLMGRIGPLNIGNYDQFVTPFHERSDLEPYADTPLYHALLKALQRKGKILLVTDGVEYTVMYPATTDPHYDDNLRALTAQLLEIQRRVRLFQLEQVNLENDVFDALRVNIDAQNQRLRAAGQPELPDLLKRNADLIKIIGPENYIQVDQSRNEENLAELLAKEFVFPRLVFGSGSEFEDYDANRELRYPHPQDGFERSEIRTFSAWQDKIITAKEENLGTENQLAMRLFANDRATVILDESRKRLSFQGPEADADVRSAEPWVLDDTYRVHHFYSRDETPRVQLWNEDPTNSKFTHRPQQVCLEVGSEQRYAGMPERMLLQDAHFYSSENTVNALFSTFKDVPGQNVSSKLAPWDADWVFNVYAWPPESIVIGAEFREFIPGNIETAGCQLSLASSDNLQAQESTFSVELTNGPDLDRVLISLGDENGRDIAQVLFEAEDSTYQSRLQISRIYSFEAPESRPKDTKTVKVRHEFVVRGMTVKEVQQKTGKVQVRIHRIPERPGDSIKTISFREKRK